MVTYFIRRSVALLFVTTLLGSASAAPVFPVKYSANNRYLVDQNDTPFPIMGRTAWFVLSLPVGDYRTFVDDTAARGYSVIELHVINHDPRGNQPPFNGNGDLPFLKRLDGTTWNGLLSGSAPDFTTPNEAYWSFLDGFLSYCESKGILVFLFPAYVGFQGSDQGWMQEMVANGTTNMQSYGAWIATRYQNQRNLIWMMGGDMGTGSNPFNAAQTSVENALLTGLKSVTGQQSVLFSAEWDSGSIATDQVTFGAAMTLNGVYSWSGDVNSHGRRAYSYTPVEPAFLLEEPFDEEGADGNGNNSAATQPVRRFQWWGWLSTIGGYVSGNGYVIWFRAPAWRDHLDTQGSRDMGRLNAFMGSIAWHNLVPSGLDGMRTLITAGGSFVSSSDYVAASATPDGTLLVAYVPPAHNGPITVDMGALSGPARARWFDPTSAAYTIIGTGLPNTGSRSFSIPGNNSVGARDWVLVLDSASGPPSAAPTISDIPNQATTVNTATPAIPFTISDADTPLGNLTLSAGSSNPTLVPTNNIVFGGSGANRTVTVTPAPIQTGVATITVTVSDGNNNASDLFQLTVSAVNTPPTITEIADQTINEDLGTALGFTVGDAETSPGSLTLSKGTSNPALVPTNNIVFGGSGSNRTATVMPAANQNGSATITVSVSDGQMTTSTDFVVTVSAVNDAPTITGIADQTIPVNGTVGPLSFTIGDVETAAGSLALSGDSSNPTLVPTSNIALGGSGANRTVMVTPAANQTGSATITVGVSDGQMTTSAGFLVTVGTLFEGTESFTNATAITIPDLGAATPYPSTVNVTGMDGTITNVTVMLRSLSHTWKSDLDILLVSPGGQKVMMMSDAGSTYTASGSVTITSSDAAAGFLPVSSAISSGTYKLTDYTDSSQGGDNFPSPAPAGPYATTLSAFNGQSPNGTWLLYVFDDGPGDLGSFANGWSLTVTTLSASSSAAPTISDIPNQSTMLNTPTAVIPFTINDADTPTSSLTLSAGSSNPTLVPPGNIVFGGSGANRTVTVTPANNQTGSATITVTVSDGANSASDPFVVTVNPGNTPPTMTGIADQTISEDTSTAALGFTVGDAETSPGSLTLSKGSSNPTLVPINSIVLGGSGANRTVTVTPAANQTGSATITVSVSDGQYTVSTNFLLTVNAVNDAPTITAIGNQTINVNTSTGPLNFTIGDADAPAGSLTLSTDSSNQTLVPLNNIVLGGSGANRTVTVTAAANQTGSATITVSVSDGQYTTSTSFVLTVTAQPAGLVAAYGFNEGTGTTLNDVSGNGITGTINGATWTAGGKYGSALSYNGSSSYVDLGNPAALQITGSMTWSAWVKAAANPADDGQILAKSDSASGWQFKTSPDTGPHTFGVGVSGGVNSHVQRYSTTVRSLDVWYHVASVYDAAARTLDIYVNGVLNNGTLSGSIPASQINSAVNVNIGRRTGGFYFNGIIDEVRVYNRALSATEIQSDMNTPVGGSPPPPPPTISDIPDQTTAVNTPTPAIPFTVDDADTPAGILALSATSSNPTLVPPGNIVFGGSGTNRTVTVTPANNQTGSATITVTVSDGTNSASDPFVLTVNPGNTPPTITGIADQTISEDTSTGPISFIVGDAETPPGSLTLSQGTSNPTLVPTSNIVFEGSGSDRTVTVTPAAGQSGSATITVSVSDGQLSASTSFVLTVSTLSGGTASFTNTSGITIPDAGQGTPYPSLINVSGMAGPISQVTVTLRNLNHTWGNDIDVLLVGPGGQKMTLMSDAGTGSTANNANLTFSDGAAGTLPQNGSLIGGTYKPTDYAPATTFPLPAPAGPYATTLSAFNGQSANGAWSLYVFDDGSGDQGSFAGGWSITITTATSSESLSALPGPLQITSLTFDAGGIVQVTVIGEADATYALEASSDLVNWTRVGVQPSKDGSVVFREQPTNSIRFYRAISISQ